MKNLVLLAFLALSTVPASATSYWFDYCDVATEAKSFLVHFRPGYTVDANKSCRRTSYVRPETAACLQSLTDVSRFKGRATYEVIVKTEQGREFTVEVKTKMGVRAHACIIRSMKIK